MLRSWKKLWLLGAGIAAVALTFFVITGVVADSNAPGTITGAIYNGTAQTLTVTGTTNCAKQQEMGVSFFIFPNKPDATIDVLTVDSQTNTASNVVATPVGLPNRLYIPGTLKCTAGIGYTVVLSSPGGGLATAPAQVCNVEYHVKNNPVSGQGSTVVSIGGKNWNITADGPGRSIDNSVDTYPGFVYPPGSCFTIPHSNLEVIKTADAPEVDYGTQIGFKISVRNASAGAANDVVVSDDLPDGSGITWSVRKASTTNAACVATGGIAAASCNVVGFTGGTTCTIAAGTVTAQALTCTVGTVPANTTTALFVVHVTSPTTRDSADCPNGATYDNTATGTTSTPQTNPPIDGTASVVVDCPSTTLDKHVASNSDVKITATYTYNETNDGNVDLHNVSVSDNQCGTSHGDAANPTYVSGDDGDGLLNPGEAWLFTCTHTYTLTTNPQDFTNIGTGSGTSVLNHVVTDCGTSAPGTRICNSNEKDSTTIHVEITVN